MPISTGTTTPRFLEAATPAHLLRAVAANHRAFLEREVRVAGGEIHREGVRWIVRHGSGVMSPGASIPFPRLRASDASAQLAAIVASNRAAQPPCPVNCWSLTEQTTPPDLGGRLLALGFEWGWRPHWMALDLSDLPDEQPLPPGVRVGPVTDVRAWDAPDLLSRAGTRSLGRLGRMRPRHAWHFAAWLDGRPIGQSVLHVTTGRLGVAGIFSVAVLPEHRRQGIGSAVMLAALRQARAVGCHYSVLNATPEGELLYRRLGYTSLGYGQTWWLHRETLEQPSPTPETIAFVEAIARGDLAALATLLPALPDELFDAILPCGLTPVQIAVKFRQSAALEWLTAHGATLDVISAWDLDGAAAVAALLAATPALANHPLGRWRLSPLHEAIVRGDEALARAILAADPDLTRTDARFGGTAHDWARHLHRPAIGSLIAAHHARATTRDENGAGES